MKHSGRTKQAEIAQLVEHTTENCGVVSSILTLGTKTLRSVLFSETRGITESVVSVL
jgi:hypothetical protein